MKILSYIIISALLLTYVPVQLLSLLTVDNFTVVYGSIFLCLLINGLFIHLVSRNVRQTSKFTNKGQKSRASDKSRTQRSNNRNKPKSNTDSGNRKASNVNNNEELVGTVKWYSKRKSYGFILDLSLIHI